LQLNFVGVTVEENRPYVHFASTQHTFAPVAIGELHSPTQVYELYNGGAIPVNYQLDLTPLSAVKQVSLPVLQYRWIEIYLANVCFHKTA